MKRYRVTLTDAERHDRQTLTRSGTAAARTLTHARILLKAATPPDQPGAFDADIAAAVAVSSATVERVRRRFVEEGLDAALVPHPSTQAHPTTLDGRGEARLIAEVCSAPPTGRDRWTLRLLAQRLIDLEVVTAIAYETVRQTRKKTS